MIIQIPLMLLRLDRIQNIEQVENTKAQKMKTCVSKEYVENADLFKTVLNKIKNTRE